MVERPPLAARSGKRLAAPAIDERNLRLSQDQIEFRFQAPARVQNTTSGELNAPLLSTGLMSILDRKELIRQLCFYYLLAVPSVENRPRAISAKYDHRIWGTNVRIFVETFIFPRWFAPNNGCWPISGIQ